MRNGQAVRDVDIVGRDEVKPQKGAFLKRKRS
jgi:hypothetical protein